MVIDPALYETCFCSALKRCSLYPSSYRLSTDNTSSVSQVVVDEAKPVDEVAPPAIEPVRKSSRYALWSSSLNCVLIYIHSCSTIKPTSKVAGARQNVEKKPTRKNGTKTSVVLSFSICFVRFAQLLL